MARLHQERRSGSTNDPMEAHYIGFNMWVKAVEKAGTTDPDKVIDAIVGVSVPNLSGGYRDDDAATTTSPNRCSSAKSKPTASSRPFGRRPASSSATNGRISCPTPRS